MEYKFTPGTDEINRGLIFTKTFAKNSIKEKTSHTG